MLLSNFQSMRPPFESTQEETLNWLVEAHTQSELMLNPDSKDFKNFVKEKIWHVGCKPDRIGKRGHILSDFLHHNWEKMSVYQLDKFPKGADLSTRSKIYGEFVDTLFENYYPEGTPPPNDLIHVSCTGYLSPSGAQKIVSTRNWGSQTTVTHAYHMGCYGSLPAIRMGMGFLNNSPESQRTDIVHTEICSLHSNPSLHQLDQLVSQTLFADGFMKYSLTRQTDQPHIKVHRVLEEIIPNSVKAMTWNVVDWGFQMSLAKEVAVLITRHLEGYLERLCQSQIQNAIFAVHPGGPKILLHIQKILGLTDKQMEHSFDVLYEYGNMSSATIPHIWDRILKDPSIPNGTSIISLAFGPGLTIAGAHMEKICGS